MAISLRGLVYDRYKTINAFAKKLNWSRSKTSIILSGKQHPNTKEIEQMAEALDINDSHTFMEIFFPQVSTK